MLREKVTDDEDWSGWERVMGPKNTDGLTQKRQGSGYTIPDLNSLGIGDECGIYEFSIEMNYGKKRYPVYLGSTCRCDNQCANGRNTKCGIRTRILEYCNGGSHKSTIFNQAIDHGMKIYVRTRKVNVNDESEIKKTAARAAEDALLRKYDYAWNIRENGKQKVRSVDGITLKPITHPCSFCIKTGL